MNTLRIAQIAAVCATVDVDQAALRGFTTTFSDALFHWGTVAVDFQWQRMAVTTRAPALAAFSEVRRFLLQNQVNLDFDDRLADTLVAFEKQDVEVTVKASKSAGLDGVFVRFLGPWTSRSLWDALPKLGVTPATASAWDELRGHLRPDGILSVGLGVEGGSLFLEVEIDQRFPADEADARAAQLGWAGGRVGVTEAQRAWLRDVSPLLFTRENNTTPVSVRLHDGKALPYLRLTIPNVPHTIPLKLMADLSDNPDFGLRLGATMAAMDVTDDTVWRMHLDVSDSAKPEGWVELKG